jgi:hypothetical protein
MDLNSVQTTQCKQLSAIIPVTRRTNGDARNAQSLSSDPVGSPPIAAKSTTQESEEANRSQSTTFRPTAKPMPWQAHALASPCPGKPPELPDAPCGGPSHAVRSSIAWSRCRGRPHCVSGVQAATSSQGESPSASASLIQECKAEQPDPSKRHQPRHRVNRLCRSVYQASRRLPLPLQRFREPHLPVRGEAAS